MDLHRDDHDNGRHEEDNNLDDYDGGNNHDHVKKNKKKQVKRQIHLTTNKQTNTKIHSYKFE